MPSPRGRDYIGAGQFESFGMSASMIRNAKSARRFAGHQSRSRWCADSGRGIGIGKQAALQGESVEVGSVELLIAVAVQILPA